MAFLVYYLVLLVIMKWHGRQNHQVSAPRSQSFISSLLTICRRAPSCHFYTIDRNGGGSAHSALDASNGRWCSGVGFNNATFAGRIVHQRMLFCTHVRFSTTPRRDVATVVNYHRATSCTVMYPLPQRPAYRFIAAPRFAPPLKCRRQVSYRLMHPSGYPGVRYISSAPEPGQS